MTVEYYLKGDDDFHSEMLCMFMADSAKCFGKVPLCGLISHIRYI